MMRDKESSLANASSSFSFPCTPWQWSTLAHLYFIQGSIIKLFTSSCLPLPNKQSVFPKYCLVVWEVRESQQTWGSISAESHRDLQSQGKAGTDKFQFRKWAREWTLWFFGFFFFSEMILIEKYGYFSEVTRAGSRTDEEHLFQW